MIIPLHLIELIDLSNKLEDFVIKSTKIFDDSHNHVHMKNVVVNSFKIIDNDEEIRNKIAVFPEII